MFHIPLKSKLVLDCNPKNKLNKIKLSTVDMFIVSMFRILFSTETCSSVSRTNAKYFL